MRWFQGDRWFWFYGEEPTGFFYEHPVVAMVLVSVVIGIIGLVIVACIP